LHEYEERSKILGGGSKQGGAGILSWAVSRINWRSDSTGPRLSF
jgi:hypothetical protein